MVHVNDFANMDTLGFEPRAFRMRSGCDTTTPCARDRRCNQKIQRRILIDAKTADIDDDDGDDTGDDDGEEDDDDEDDIVDNDYDDYDDDDDDDNNDDYGDDDRNDNKIMNRSVIMTRCTCIENSATGN